MQPKIENKTIMAIAFFVAIISVMLGLGSLGIIKFFKFGEPQFYGIFMILCAVVLFTERFAKGITSMDTENALAILLGIFAILLGVWQIIGRVLSPTMEGVQGVVLLVLGVMVTINLFK